MNNETIMTASKEAEMAVLRKHLSKLPRDDMRAILRKKKLPTGHQKAQTVNNLVKALVG